MALPELCDRCGTYPPNVIMSLLDDGTTRYLCWLCVSQVADGVIDAVTGDGGTAEPEPDQSEPEPDPPIESIGAGHGQVAPKRSRREKAEPEPEAAEGEESPAPTPGGE